MRAPMLLKHAAAIVEQRRRSYGEPAAYFEAVSQRWSVTLGTKITPRQVVLCLLDLKQQRLANDPTHLDSIADTAGYAAILSELER